LKEKKRLEVSKHNKLIFCVQLKLILANQIKLPII